MIELLLPERPQQLPELTSLQRASWWLSGFAVLCDWLGSGDEQFHYCSEKLPLEVYWQRALQSAKQALDRAGLEPLVASDRLDLIQLFGLYMQSPTPLQQSAYRCELSQSPQLFILEDITGSGKTEAALTLAHRLMAAGSANGLYFALPTMATSNAMYERMGKVYRKLYREENRPSLVLAHGARQLSESFRHSYWPSFNSRESDYGDATTSASLHCSFWLADNRKKALLAPVGVGTIDQALLAILPSRHQSLRLLGLLDKVLIVDEVHACDGYMHRLLCQLLYAHAAAGGSAILLSATLPFKQRRELLSAFAEACGETKPRLERQGLKDYPLLSHWSAERLEEQVVESRGSVSRSVEVAFCHSVDEVLQRLQRSIEAGEAGCWIRNTVKDAVESFAYIREHYPEWKVELFHARFMLLDRLKIESRVLKRFGKKSGSAERRGTLLIATQVVEQSLDLDFDQLISDLAPIDLLIQRAGRLRRHARDREGNPVAGDDQRGGVTLTLHAPELEGEPSANWFADFLPNAQAVYADHGRLWLTAMLLKNRGGFRMPEDARLLIEGVYGDLAEEVPEALLHNSLQAEGVEKGQRGLADENGLKLEKGYQQEGGYSWWEEAVTPTRLGDETISLYLACWDGNELLPWASDEKVFQWAYSSVQLRQRWLKEIRLPAGLSQERFEQYQQQLPAKGKWGLLVPLQPVDGGWQATGLDAKGREITLFYDEKQGVSLKS